MISSQETYIYNNNGVIVPSDYHNKSYRYDLRIASDTRGQIIPTKIKYCNHCVFPNEFGSFPLILQKLRSKHFNAESLNKCDGSGPDKYLKDTLRITYIYTYIKTINDTSYIIHHIPCILV